MCGFPLGRVEARFTNHAGCVLVTRTKVIFVGSFNAESRHSCGGGQLFACNQLLTSKLSEQVEWILVGSSPTPPDISLRGLRVICKGVRRYFRFLRTLILARTGMVLILAANGPGFIERGSMVLIAKLAGSKVVFAPRSGLIERDVRRSRYWKQFVTCVIRNSDIVICQSAKWRQFYGELIGDRQDRLRVIPNWIDIPDSLCDGAVERDCNAPVRLLFAGSLERSKGIYELLEAMSMLSEEDAVLTVCGVGSEHDRICDNIETLGIESMVEMRGWVTGDDKAREFRNADICVLASFYEGYPNSLIEAMMYGVPVVATAVGSVPDIVIDDKNGLLVAPGSASELATRLKRLIRDENLRARLGVNASETVRRNNAVSVAVSSFASIFRELTPQ